MKKQIWIVNEHLTSPDISKSGHSRHYSLGKEFIKGGYDVTLITSSFSHNPHRKVPLKGILKIIDGNVRTLVLKGFSYQKTNSLIRIINWFLFFMFFFLAPFTRLPKPDIIIVSSTPMLPVYNVLFFKIFYRKCKFIFETRDLWPLTPMGAGNYSPKSPFIKVLSHLEYKCYSKADYIVSVLINSYKHVENVLGTKDFKFKWISNGINLVDFKKDQKEIKWDFLKNKKDPFIVGYAGTLGKVNAMEFLIETFNQHFNKTDVYLVILGNGGEQQKLVDISSENENIIFYDAVDRNFLLSFYNCCDVLSISWRNLELYKYGISANKIFEYMFARKPILFSGNCPDNVVEISGCGIIAEPENIVDIKKKILEIKSLSKSEREEMGKKGYNYLVNHLTYDKLAEGYIKIFQDLLGQKNKLK
ncbi:glycosyltransferase family 4 protein [uncultured Aquimarina sp.]|uniref:glycosyltransferase family 4 protein n=1 Tax=uncultured Aquimarina sp. TaxID=575652 RepID=UPI0026364ADB|nr:glycosyltransferase family 4 protein [uncultured Aquimarina sp.]